MEGIFVTAAIFALVYPVGAEEQTDTALPVDRPWILLGESGFNETWGNKPSIQQRGWGMSPAIKSVEIPRGSELQVIVEGLRVSRINTQAGNFAAGGGFDREGFRARVFSYNCCCFV